MDFDDLLMIAVKLFETVPAVLETYQDRFRYILVDGIKTRIMRNIGSRRCWRASIGICVVGDDDQSIYSFRGADLKNILSFGGTIRRPR
jgi:DNA helicase-2/ATP-dependent DNA helicase PcrA